MALSRRIREHVRSNVVAYLALFVALGAAPAWAVTIGASDIQRNAVRSRHIKAMNVRRTDLAIGAVNSRRVANGSLRGADIDETTLSRRGHGRSRITGTLCATARRNQSRPRCHPLAVAGSGGAHPTQGEPYGPPGGRGLAHLQHLGG